MLVNTGKLEGMNMEYYFDMEVALDAESLEANKAGRRIALTPSNCRIITMQFQLIDRSGRPASPLIVRKVWEDPQEGGVGTAAVANDLHVPRMSEQQEAKAEERMIRQFVDENFSNSPWDFIPVGYNVLFDLGMLRGRAEKYGIELPIWDIYHNRPFIDIKHILLGMNGFAFKDSGLDKFCGKGGSGKDVPIWYERAQKGDPLGYGLIEQYVEHEAEEFVELYARLKAELPRLRTQMGLFSENFVNK